MKNKKKVCILSVTVIILLIWISYFHARKLWFVLDENDHLAVEVRYGGGKELIQLWYNESEEMYYLFLPSDAVGHGIGGSCRLGSELSIDGGILYPWSVFTWQKDAVYKVQTKDRIYPLKIMRSENIPSLFIQTDMGDMEYLDADKAHWDSGRIRVASELGETEYDGGLECIGARGNSTMWCGKKSYRITLEEQRQICGMDAGKRWNLLALFYEHDKIHSKMVYDMARFLEMEYAPDTRWVNLYCNGTYKGLYLLTETVKVGENRLEIHDLEEDNVIANSDIDLEAMAPRRTDSDSYFEINNGSDISGGYLLERKTDGRLKEGEAYFPSVTVPYCFFAVNAPEHPSKEQLQYIKSFVNGIELMLFQRDPNYKNFVDEDSFAKQFLIDALTLEVDAMKQSTFYYKERGQDILKSGPIWDYDKSMGTIVDDYETPIDENFGEMSQWYMPLYEDEDFRTLLTADYQKLLPYLEWLHTEGIDEYVDFISSAVEMDEIILTQYDREDVSRGYCQYDNYIRYLKFYLAKRVHYLNELWDIEYPEFTVPPSNGSVHTITFMGEDESIVAEYEIPDGEMASEMPELSEEYLGWQFHHSRKPFHQKIPVYEDMILYPMRQEE